MDLLFILLVLGVFVFSDVVKKKKQSRSTDTDAMTQDDMDDYYGIHIDWGDPMGTAEEREGDTLSRQSETMVKEPVLAPKPEPTPVLAVQSYPMVEEDRPVMKPMTPSKPTMGIQQKKRSITAKQAKQGIIWSVVLDRPKALKRMYGR